MENPLMLPRPIVSISIAGRQTKSKSSSEMKHPFAFYIIKQQSPKITTIHATYKQTKNAT